MHIRWLVIAALVVTLLGMGVPRSVDALSCIPLADVVAKMDVIVRGEIRAIPEKGLLELTVSRYYKGGIGSAQVRAEVAGIGQGQRMDWNSVPKVGDELIIGFVKRGKALSNEACNLFVQLQGGQEPPQEVKNLIGEGQVLARGEQSYQVQESGTVEPGQDRTDQSRKALKWASGGGLVLVGVALWTIWRRRE